MALLAMCGVDGCALQEHVRRRSSTSTVRSVPIFKGQSIQAGSWAQREADWCHGVFAADLEVPIIEQDTVRVIHVQSPEDYASLGRDVESQVRARAIHAPIHSRSVINGTRTVDFTATPGSFALEGIR